MRPEPLQKVDETEQIFGVSDWHVAEVLTKKLYEEFPKYDFVKRSDSFSDMVSIRIGSGLNERDFFTIVGFTYGYFKAIKHLYPQVKYLIIFGE